MESGGIDSAVARRRVMREGMVVVQERDALKLRGASTIQQTVIACHVRLFLGHLKCWACYNMKMHSIGLYVALRRVDDC